MLKTRIILDAHGAYYSMRVTLGQEKKSWLPLACHVLCEDKVKRPHLTCLWCRGRRVYYGKMPAKIPVDVIVLTISKLQKHKVIKAKVRKVLLTLTGWTLN